MTIRRERHKWKSQSRNPACCHVLPANHHPFKLNPDVLVPPPPPPLSYVCASLWGKQVSAEPFNNRATRGKCFWAVWGRGSGGGGWPGQSARQTAVSQRRSHVITIIGYRGEGGRPAGLLLKRCRTTMSDRTGANLFGSGSIRDSF